MGANFVEFEIAMHFLLEKCSSLTIRAVASDSETLNAQPSISSSKSPFTIKLPDVSTRLTSSINNSLVGPSVLMIICHEVSLGPVLRLPSRSLSFARLFSDGECKIVIFIIDLFGKWQIAWDVANIQFLDRMHSANIVSSETRISSRLDSPKGSFQRQMSERY